MQFDCKIVQIYPIFVIMIERKLAQKVFELAGKFPVITVTGPRQSGKTTLLKSVFPNHLYFNFEELDVRDWATSDPRGFLHENPGNLFLDEVQKVPVLFSYMQSIVDSNNIPGQFILSGSQSFLLNEKISQSLAGRAAILELLPFCRKELENVNEISDSDIDFIIHGGYPRIYDAKISPSDFYPSYIRTYVERDVRPIQNIPDLSLFQRFLKLCAGRIGQLINLSSLATDCGISVNTAKGWLSILEQSYIVFVLRPHFQNFSKRLVKMPKLYFYDTGLACSLLEIENTNMLVNHYLRGGLFENLVIMELLKNRFNEGKTSNIYFWRNNHGNEIDCIIQKANVLTAIEIKSGKTFHPQFLKGLDYWEKLSGNKNEMYLVYGGEIQRNIENKKLIPWQKAGDLILTSY